MLAAVGIDVNNCIYPIAYAIVERKHSFMALVFDVVV